MRGELLLDTGALVSLLDRSQTHHLKCRRAFADWTGPVVSTEAVLTEATHLLAGVQGGRAACVDFFLSGGALLVPSSTTSLQRVRKLLDKYADLPMDFADATLVALEYVTQFFLNQLAKFLLSGRSCHGVQITY